MEIRKDRWHYKLYDFTHLLRTGGTPRGAYSCRYWWRIILMTVPVAIMFCILLLILLVALVVTNVVLVLLGIGYAVPALDSKTDMFDHKQFPEMKIGRRSFRLGEVLWLLYAGAAGFWIVRGIYHTLPAIAHRTTDVIHGAMAYASPKGVAAFFGIALALLAVFGLIVFARNFFRSETWELWKKHYRAWKDGVCPWLDFVDSPKKDS